MYTWRRKALDVISVLTCSLLVLASKPISFQIYMAAGRKRDHLSCGRELLCSPSIFDSLNEVKNEGFEFVLVPFVEPSNLKVSDAANVKDHGSIRSSSASRADLTLDTQDWSSLVVCRASRHIKCDSSDVLVRVESEHTLSSELNYAAYLGLPAVMISLEPSSNINLARIVYNFCLGISNFIFWVEVPLFFDSNSQNRESGKGDDGQSELEAWNTWNQFRLVSNYNKRVSIVLRLTKRTPSIEMCKKWVSEPVKCLIIDTDVFTVSKTGIPTLSTSQIEFISIIVGSNNSIQMVLSGKSQLDDGEFLPYYQHLNQVWKEKPLLDTIEDFSQGYENFLQIPLQPLQDNLESQTYEVFEKDPVKYPRYQEAIGLAIADKLKENSDAKLVLMVLGAGRGPLVRCAIAAAEKINLENYTLYAVEKNPNAIVTLEFLREKYWGDSVKVISCDMRDVVLDDKADIIISELLGSFSDNELSPECLDGANRLLKPNAISIPCRYTSHIAPISSHIMHVECSHSRELDKPWDHCLETPYVVRLVNYEALDETKPLFSFHHPNREENIDNKRQEVVEFTSNTTTVLNGIAGYFDTVLYKDVTLSIVPSTHSPGMFSWFPIYFPLKTPVHVKAGETVTVHFWRCLDKHKVWYEWCVSTPFPTPIHNSNGRSSFIGK